MSRLHRFILLCLLAVAIPLQGFAAAAMTHCGAAPVEAPVAMDDMPASLDMQMSMDADTHEHADAKSAAHKGGCSACAACCAVAAPGTTFAPSFATIPAEAVDLPKPRHRVAFLTDGPERPPRPDLA